MRRSRAAAQSHPLRNRCKEALTAHRLRAIEPDAGPGVSPVDRLEGAAPHAGAVARIALARARPDDVRVRLEDRHGPDPEGRLAVEDRVPGQTPVDRLEESPVEPPT
jgi:hypothetical protein